VDGGSMKVCKNCDRVIDLCHIEVVWVDNIHCETIVEVYCGEHCLRSVL